MTEDPENNNSNRSADSFMGAGIAMGVTIGAAMLASTGDSWWIAIGICFGVAAGAILGQSSRGQ